MNKHANANMDQDTPKAKAVPTHGRSAKRQADKGPANTEKKDKQSELRKLVHQLARQLNETKPGPIKQIETIVRHFGPEIALAIAKEVEDIEARGGIMTLNGQRRRTPGGVFFYLAKGRMTPEERDRLLPNRYTRVKLFRQMLREKNASLPPFVWEKRRALIEPLLAEQGAVDAVKITLIGRPGKIESFQNLIVTVMTHSGKYPDMPLGVPTPPETPASYTVYISSRQWYETVDKALEKNPNDQLIVEGFCSYDNAIGTLVVYATSVTTKRLAAKEAKAKKQAEKQAAAQQSAKPQKPAQQQPQHQQQSQQKSAPPQPAEPKAASPRPVEPKAASPRPAEPKATSPRPVEPKAAPPRPAEPKAAPPRPAEPKAAPPKQGDPAPTPSSSPTPSSPADRMSPADAQRLRELHASAALFRQKVAAIEAKPEGERFGLEMTRKLLEGIEADIAALERKYSS